MTPTTTAITFPPATPFTLAAPVNAPHAALLVPVGSLSVFHAPVPVGAAAPAVQVPSADAAGVSLGQEEPQLKIPVTLTTVLGDVGVGTQVFHAGAALVVLGSAGVSQDQEVVGAAPAQDQLALGSVGSQDGESAGASVGQAGT